jgi:hypothetical protein
MGIYIQDSSEKETILVNLDEIIDLGESELRVINDYLNIWQQRLERIGGSIQSEAYPAKRLDDARRSLETLRAEIHRLTAGKLAEASEQAAKAYNALISDQFDDAYKPFRELRRLGLVSTVEDDL